MNKEPIGNFSKSKISSSFLIDMDRVKGHYKYYLLTLENDDEENAMLTIYCFNCIDFCIFLRLTEKDNPPVLVTKDDLYPVVFQIFNQDLFAGLSKMNKIKELSHHAKFIKPDAVFNEAGAVNEFTVEMVFKLYR